MELCNFCFCSVWLEGKCGKEKESSRFLSFFVGYFDSWENDITKSLWVFALFYFSITRLEYFLGNRTGGEKVCE